MLGTFVCKYSFTITPRFANDVCRDGTSLLPSVVHFPAEGGVVVGAAALGRATRDPARTLASVKRFMGRGADDPETERLGSYRFAPATTEE